MSSYLFIHSCLLRGDDSIRVEALGGALVQNVVDWHNGKVYRIQETHNNTHSQYEVFFMVPSTHADSLLGLEGKVLTDEFDYMYSTQ